MFMPALASPSPKARALSMWIGLLPVLDAQKTATLRMPGDVM
jgi:hypothetical protein